MGLDHAEMDGGGDQQQQRPSVFTRRAGSSWNRGNSAWKFGGRETQRVRSPARRRAATDISSMSAADVAEATETAEALEAASISNTNGVSQNTVGSATESFSNDPRVELNIKKENGCFRVKGSVETAVDPDTLYGIITDYSSNARIFRNVDRVEVEDNGGEKLVTQFLHWNFLMWSGNYNIKMKMKDDPQNRTISYELAQPGFLKVFNGSWTVEPLTSEGTPSTSKLILNQRALPSFFPPGPLAVGAGSYAQKIMSNQVTNLLTDLAVEASEIKKNTGTSP